METTTAPVEGYDSNDGWGDCAELVEARLVVPTTASDESSHIPVSGMVPHPDGGEIVGLLHGGELAIGAQNFPRKGGGGTVLLHDRGTTVEPLRAFSGPGVSHVRVQDVGPHGSILVVGHHGDRIDPHRTTDNEGESGEAFVALLEPDGSTRWIRSWRDGELLQGASLLADGSVVAGVHAYRSAVLDELTVLEVEPEVGEVWALVRWNPDGSVAWARPQGGQGMLAVTALHVDPMTGDSWMGGTMSASGVVTFGPGEVGEVQRNPASREVFVAGLGGDGSLDWVTFGSAAAAQVDAVVSLPDGGAVAAGTFMLAFRLGLSDGPSRAVSSDRNEGWLAAFDDDGSLRWLRRTTGVFASGARSSGVELTGDGGLLWLGDFSGYVAFGEGEDGRIGWQAPGYQSLYLLRMSLDGTVRCGVRLGSEGAFPRLDQVAQTPAGSWLLGVSVYGDFRFGTHSPGDAVLEAPATRPMRVELELLSE